MGEGPLEKVYGRRYVEEDPLKVRGRRFVRKGLREKVHQRRSAGEGPLEKVCGRRFAGESLSEKVRRRSFVKEGPPQKVCGRGSVRKEGCRWKRANRKEGCGRKSGSDTM